MKFSNFFITLIAVFIFPISVISQTCPNPNAYNQINLPSPENIRIIACVQNEVTFGSQKVNWVIKNLSSDVLTVIFTEVIYTTCGTVKRYKWTCYAINPGEMSGYNDWDRKGSLIWDNECKGKQKINNVTYENLIIRNLSKEKRDKEEGEKIKRETQLEQERKERELREQKAKADQLAKEKVNEKKTMQQRENTQNGKTQTNVTSARQGAKAADQNETKTGSGDSYTYVESEEARRIRERANAQNNANQAEDMSAMAGIGSVVGLGALLTSNTDNDFEDKDYAFIMRGTLGVNYQSIPVTKNTVGGFGESKSSSTSPLCMSAGLDFKFFSNKFIGFNINPYFNYGTLAFSSSTGDMMSYGGNVNVKFGRKFQLVLKGGFESREGYDTYDAAAFGINGFTSSSYNYHTIKYGMGLRYEWIELSLHKENISFLTGIPADVYSYELTMDHNIFGALFRFAPNYPIAGEVKFPNIYKKEQQDLFQIGFYWRFALAKS